MSRLVGKQASALLLALFAQACGGGGGASGPDPGASSADLASLVVSSGVLTPAFDPAVTGYSVTVRNATTTLTVTPTSAGQGATITVNGVLVASGSPSLPNPLAVGANPIVVRVVSPDTTVTKDYVVNALRSLSDNARLASLVVTSGVLTPSFDPAVRTYGGGTVPFLTGAARITASAEDPAATIEVAGVVVASGQQGPPLTLAPGPNVLVVRVTAADGTTVRDTTVTVVRQAASSLAQEAFVKASNTGAFDGFGTSIALDGDTLAVGAPSEASDATGVNGDQNNDNKPASGAVYVFRRTGGIWAQEAYLKASNTDDLDAFGFSLALDGDTLAVGAFGEDSNAVGTGGDQSDNSQQDSGAVYVFVRNGTVWSQQAYVKASNTQAGDAFGAALALRGNLLAVGAEGEDSSAVGIGGDQSDNSQQDSGAVYLFERSGTAWSQAAYAKASNTDAGDLFGFALAAGSSGSMLVVGAPGEASATAADPADDSAPGSGAVYVLARGAAGWSQAAYLKASNPDAGDRFGTALALDGTLLAVGAPDEDSSATGSGGNQADNGATDSGAAYAFGLVGGTWTQAAYLKASNTEAGDRFGLALSVADQLLLVGAPREDGSSVGVNGNEADNGSVDSGAAYLLRRSSSTGWLQDAYLKGAPLAFAELGAALALQLQSLALGVPVDDSSATGVNGTPGPATAPASGAARLFR